jgi:two-component system, LytTR family, response regulator
MAIAWPGNPGRGLLLNLSSMIDYVLIDDEPRNIRLLRQMLEEFCPQTSYSGAAADAEEAVALILQLQPDLVFLDIQLAAENAFTLLDRLLPVKFEIIFVTAFDEHSLKAFRYSALDYLLKPINVHELRSAVDRASAKLELRNRNCQLQNQLANLRTQHITAHKLAVSNAESLIFISIADIVRCEAKGGYTEFHMKNGDKILSTKTIKDYEDLLPPDMFLRIHHHHIVNILFVKKYYRGRGGYIEMEDQVTIEVSIRRKNAFLGRFGI